MTTKLVVRVLDAEGALLAWAPVWALAKGDGCLWVSETYQAAVETPGTPAFLSVHWADINIEIRQPFAGQPLAVGQLINLHWDGPVIIVGPAAGGLPPVTVRGAVQIGVPAGSLGAKT